MQKKCTLLKNYAYICIRKQKKDATGGVPGTKNKSEMKTVSMRTIFAALHKEFFNEEDARNIFEWYCRTYNVDITSVAPASVAREVLGI